MSAAPAVITAPSLETEVRLGLRGRLAAYGELTKVRLSSLVLVTTAVGALLASGGLFGEGTLSLARFGLILLGTALAAFGANAWNQWLEAGLDARMTRTRGRPIPSGRLSRTEAAALAAALTIVGPALLLAVGGPLAALLALGVIASYALVYTPLKQRSAACTQIGAVCGAIPPAIGWVAVTGSMDPGAWALFGILFVWQIPHFLAIDWVYKDDYARGGFRMLSGVDPTGALSGQLALVYAMALVPVTLLTTVVGLGGWIYVVAAFGLSLAFLAVAAAFAWTRSQVWARRLFLASLAWLPLVLGLLVADPTGPIR
jgi:protoheme IX farnesyltransferase